MARRPHLRILLIVLFLVAIIAGGAACSILQPDADEPVVQATFVPANTRTPVIVATSTLPPEATVTDTPLLVTAASPTPWIMQVVASIQANVRSAPSDGGTVMGTVLRGAEVEVVEFSKEWYKVRAEGVEGLGWMHQSVLAEMLTRELGEGPANIDLPAKLVIAARSVANVRSGPSEAMDLVAQIPTDTVVTAVSRSGEWFKIEADALDEPGWVHQDVLRMAAAVDLTPTVTPTPNPTEAAAPPTATSAPRSTPEPTATEAPATLTPMVFDSPYQMYVSAREAANVRAEPVDGAELVGTLVRGELVVVYEANAEWYKVRSEEFEGFGWIYWELLTPDPIH